MIIDNVEIFAVGTWPGSRLVTITETDLDDIVWSFSALRLSGRVPLKLTHEGPDARDEGFDESKSLAMGWVQKVWRENKKLMATLDVPNKVYKLIKEGYLKFVSVELIPEVQAFNRLIPWVLDAVAILGADQPAVGILKDLQSLTMRRRATLSSGSKRVVFKRANNSESHTMTDDEIKALLKKQADDNAVALSAMKTQLEAAEKRAKDADEAREKAAKDEKERTLKAKRTTIDALFNAAIEQKRFEPKVRETYAKMSRYDKDDVACEAIEIKDVEEYIKDNTKAGFKAKSEGAATEDGDKTQEVDDKSPIDEQVKTKAIAWCKARNLDATNAGHLAQAGVAVLRDNKELAAKYQRLHMTGGKP